jgi:hypothetical protein
LGAAVDRPAFATPVMLGHGRLCTLLYRIWLQPTSHKHFATLLC